MGIGHPDKLGYMFTAKQMSEMEIFWMIEPRGGIRGDMRMARICQTLANIHRSKKTGKYKDEDFMFGFGVAKKRKATTIDAMKNFLINKFGAK